VTVGVSDAVLLVLPVVLLETLVDPEFQEAVAEEVFRGVDEKTTVDDGIFETVLQIDWLNKPVIDCVKDVCANAELVGVDGSVGFDVTADVTEILKIGETEAVVVAVGDSVFARTVEVILKVTTDEIEGDDVVLDDINEDNEIRGVDDGKPEDDNVSIIVNVGITDCDTIVE
jgi:hypothetical protein